MGITFFFPSLLGLLLVRFMMPLQVLGTFRVVKYIKWKEAKEKAVKNFLAKYIFLENDVSRKLRCFMEVLWAFVRNLNRKRGCDVREGSLPYFSLVLLV